MKRRAALIHSGLHAILRVVAEKKNPAAVALGRKGGKNSRKNLTPQQKKRLAQKAADARWAKAKKGAREQV
jgi:hypothetical protein